MFSDDTCMQGQSVLYITTDDVKFFNSNNVEERSEVRWLKAALNFESKHIAKVRRLLYHSLNSWDETKKPMKEAKTIVDIDLRSLMLQDTIIIEKEEIETKKPHT